MMSSSQELYNRLSEKLSALVNVTNRKQLANWIWIVVGLLQGKSPALSQIATFLPMETQAESRVTLIRRWLTPALAPGASVNWHVDVWAFYEPILEHVLQGWSAVKAYVILDGVMIFGDRWQIFRVSLQHGCRAIPLAWVVLPGKGLTSVKRLKTKLERVQRLLQTRVESVVFLADRGFRACDWAQLCLKLGWNYAIRVACNTYLTFPDGRTGRIDAFVSPYCNRPNIPIFQTKKWTQPTAESIFFLLLSSLYSLLSRNEVHIRRLQLGIAQEARFHLHADPIERRSLRVNAHQTRQ